MVQKAPSIDAPSVQGGGQHRETRFNIGYGQYQSGYNKLFTQVFIYLVFYFYYYLLFILRTEYFDWFLK